MDGSTGTPTQRQQAKAATRAKVVAAATALFNTKSYDLVTMRDIADKANVSTGSIFASFTGKQAVWEACAGASMPRPAEWRAAITALDSATERVWKPMKSSADLPKGRAVLVRADFLPFGFPCGGGIGAVGQRGSGNDPGIFIGDTFYADRRGVAFTHWAEIPAFDGEP